jgi:hypothetical protein
MGIVMLSKIRAGLLAFLCLMHRRMMCMIGFMRENGLIGIMIISHYIASLLLDQRKIRELDHRFSNKLKDCVSNLVIKVYVFIRNRQIILPNISLKKINLVNVANFIIPKEVVGLLIRKLLTEFNNHFLYRIYQYFILYLYNSPNY